MVESLLINAAQMAQQKGGLPQMMQQRPRFECEEIYKVPAAKTGVVIGKGEKPTNRHFFFSRKVTEAVRGVFRLWLCAASSGCGCARRLQVVAVRGVFRLCSDTCAFLGGETIRMLCERSGAKIELDRNNPPNPDERLFHVRGSRECVEVAKRMIEERISDMPVRLMPSQTFSLPPLLWMNVQHETFGCSRRGKAVSAPADTTRDQEGMSPLMSSAVPSLTLVASMTLKNLMDLVYDGGFFLRFLQPL